MLLTIAYYVRVMYVYPMYVVGLMYFVYKGKEQKSVGYIYNGKKGSRESLTSSAGI